MSTAEVLEKFDKRLESEVVRIERYVAGDRWKGMLRPIYSIVFDSIRELACAAFIEHMQRKKKKGIQRIVYIAGTTSSVVDVFQRFSSDPELINAAILGVFDNMVLTQDNKNPWAATHTRVRQLFDNPYVHVMNPRDVLVAFMNDNVQIFLTRSIPYTTWYVRESRYRNMPKPEVDLELSQPSFGF